MDYECRIGQADKCLTNGCAFSKAQLGHCRGIQYKPKNTIVKTANKIYDDYCNSLPKNEVRPTFKNWLINQKYFELKSPPPKANNEVPTNEPQQQGGTLDFFTLTPKCKKDFTTKKSKCPYCGDNMGRYTATSDHVKPKSKGGIIKVWTCRNCNQMKGSMSVDEFLLHIQKILTNCKITNESEFLNKFTKPNQQLTNL